VVDVLKVVAVLEVRVGEEVCHLADRRARDPPLLHFVIGFHYLVAGELALDQRQQGIVIFGADETVGKERRVGPFGITDVLQ